ncbi:kidney mitochondrial carrier protein 1 [Eurytemora carolleeae]|uniref:kidney mitochondrial carrier protein 1 n=1 Tax=Eurytemora carolleeae TaxID=1294199 RepID=UPI000C76FC03|nr:kidney mitochondrial carrier protein 1 [Eurytemora carolleeae]|eukprot:XP_023332871.1 kidney mitochondrial carrier protein 1-like [Eurytemora affinis]
MVIYCDQDRNVHYKGTLDALKSVIREDGVQRLYKGLSPALLRQGVYGTIKFGLYYSAKDLYFSINPSKPESNVLNLFCAVFAGSVSSAIATPTDVVKVRMQAKGDTKFGNLLSVFIDIGRKEGVSGLWRGVCPTAQRSAIVAGVQLPVYDWSRSYLSRGELVSEGACANLAASVLYCLFIMYCRGELVSEGACANLAASVLYCLFIIMYCRGELVSEGACANLAASVLAGLSACLASNPIDVIRTRLMIQRRFIRERGEYIQGEKIFKSSFECFSHTVRKEGFCALYKGFVPAFGRMGPWNIIFFLVYEKLKFFF